jgi:CDP-glycerol glycerophosphotransferase (TagB/SpsB family)
LIATPKERFVVLGKSVLSLALTVVWTCAVAADARERGFIQRGMPESEVLFRIGKPDEEVFIRNVKGEPEEKIWTYFPTYRDSQTVTIITLRAGIVVHIDRQ